MDNIKKHNYTYVIVNLINGKLYIGSRCTNIELDKYMGSGRLIKFAIKKYGVKNFKRINLNDFETPQEARNKEEEYINLFKSLSPSGYNLHPKGGCSYFEYSEESLMRFKKLRLGKSYNEIYGVEKAKEVKNHISENHARFWEGKTQSKETIKKKADANRGQLRTDESKNKIRQSLLGVKFSDERCKNISNSLKGNSNLAKNFGGPKFGSENPFFKCVS
jgi:hypothetical protein